MKIIAINVDEYMAQLPIDRFEGLSLIRKMIHTQIPGIVETIDYNMPVFVYQEKQIFALASQKNYTSFYVMEIKKLDPFREELKKLNVGKSCIRFKKIEDLPLNVVKNLLKQYKE